MIELFHITNNISEAEIVNRVDIDWLFLDLETEGKEERQSGLNTVKSKHSIDDVAPLRKVLTNTKLLVRSNPIGKWSKAEFDTINNTPGIDMVMLPFFKTVQEVETFLELLDTTKTEPTLLVETMGAVENLDEILKLYDFKYIHVGLNDLHIERKTKFMFEPYVDGLLDKITTVLRNNNQKYGIGGIGKVGSGLLPTPECVVKEHYRLKSTGVILSRALKGDFDEESKVSYEKNLDEAVKALREVEGLAKKLSDKELAENYEVIKVDINKVLNNL